MLFRIVSEFRLAARKTSDPGVLWRVHMRHRGSPFLLNRRSNSCLVEPRMDHRPSRKNDDQGSDAHKLSQTKHAVFASSRIVATVVKCFGLLAGPFQYRSFDG